MFLFSSLASYLFLFSSLLLFLSQLRCYLLSVPLLTYFEIAKPAHRLGKGTSIPHCRPGRRIVGSVTPSGTVGPQILRSSGRLMLDTPSSAYLPDPRSPDSRARRSYASRPRDAIAITRLHLLAPSTRAHDLNSIPSLQRTIRYDLIHPQSMA